MKDYSYSYKNTNEQNINNGVYIFNKQLEGLEGRDIIHNGKKLRGILYNHLNDMNVNFEDRGLNLPLDTTIKWGDYVYINNEPYLVMSDMDNHYYYKGCRIRKCFRELNLKGWDKPLPCYISNSSYGSKGEVFNNSYQSDFDARAVIVVGIDEDKKVNDIIEGTRFIFRHSKYDVFEVTKKVTAHHDYVELTCKYVKNVQEDDFENNIAYNVYLERIWDLDYNKKELPLVDGEEYVNINSDNSTSIFTLLNYEGEFNFILDEDCVDNNIAEIVLVEDKKCTIKVNKAKMFQIECRDLNGKLICTKTVYGVTRR